MMAPPTLGSNSLVPVDSLRSEVLGQQGSDHCSSYVITKLVALPRLVYLQSLATFCRDTRE